MAIATTVLGKGTVGPYRFIVFNHATPGTGANDVDTGADYVIAAFGQAGTTANKTITVTINTSDHSTSAPGHYTLETEADVTCQVFAIVSG